ncbi:MAG: thioredoxin-disulfide reductase [Chloroflexi bacterium]|nr:thioredoxin-disulfide reductase [Chloroflexota bacterium]
MAKEYDIIIVGGGPAGLTAAIYSARARLKTLIIEKAVPGGQIATTGLVENYPGFPDGVMGGELSQLMADQAKKFDTETISAEVLSLEVRDNERVIHTSEGDYSAKAVILAGGADPTKLGIPGENEFTGKGVSYCATCDGPFFINKVVAVIGGGDSAVDEGMFLTRFASKVIVIHRRDQLRATKIIQERAFANPKMEFIWDTVVEAIEGNEVVQRLQLKNVKTQERRTLEVGGVFVYVGLRPNTDFLKSILALSPDGHILVNEQMETAIPGIFAAGDIRVNAARQAVSAAGDGATAALAAEKYLSQVGH